MNTKIWNLQQDITQEDNTYIYNEIKNIFGIILGQVSTIRQTNIILSVGVEPICYSC